MVEIMGPHLLENPILSSCLSVTLKPVLDNTYLSRKNRFIKEKTCNPEQTTLQKNIKVINSSNLPCVMISCFFAILISILLVQNVSKISSDLGYFIAFVF
jgi:hypothetical protein